MYRGLRLTVSRSPDRKEWHSLRCELCSQQQVSEIKWDFFSRPSQVSKHSPTNYARREKGRRRRRRWWWGGGKQRGGCSAKFLRVEKQKEKWNETIEPRARALSPSSTTALMWKLPAWPPEEKRRQRRKRGKGGRFTQNEKERFASLRVFLTNGSPFGVH